MTASGTCARAGAAPRRASTTRARTGRSATDMEASPFDAVAAGDWRMLGVERARRPAPGARRHAPDGGDAPAQRVLAAPDRLDAPAGYLASRRWRLRAAAAEQEHRGQREREPEPRHER